MNEELRKLGKNGEPELLYQVSRDGLSPKTFWKKYKNHKETALFLENNAIKNNFLNLIKYE
jgi:hypothetical protein